MSKCENCSGIGQVPKEWTDDEFEEYLTDLYGTVKIGNLEFDAGRILRELDPIAFNCSMSDMEQEEDCPVCDGTGEVEE